MCTNAGFCLNASMFDYGSQKLTWVVTAPSEAIHRFRPIAHSIRAKTCVHLEQKNSKSKFPFGNLVGRAFSP